MTLRRGRRLGLTCVFTPPIVAIVRGWMVRLVSEVRVARVRLHPGVSVAAAIMVAVLAAGGCNGDPPQPSTMPTHSASSPTPSTNRTPPSTPSATPLANATTTLKHDAVAFMKKYLRAQNHLQTLADVSKVEDFYSIGCVACSQSTSIFKEHLAEHHTVSGARFLHPTVKIEGTHGATVQLKVVSDIERTKVLNSNGSLVTAYPGAKNTVYIYTLSRDKTGHLSIVQGRGLS